MRLDFVDFAIVRPLFGFGPVVSRVRVCSLREKILAAANNSSSRVYFNEGSMKFPSVGVIGSWVVE